MKQYSYQDLEEISFLKQEAELLGISLDSEIKDGESIVILRQKIEEIPQDKLNFTYGL